MPDPKTKRIPASRRRRFDDAPSTEYVLTVLAGSTQRKVSHLRNEK